MSDLFGNHFVGFPTRRLISFRRNLCGIVVKHCEPGVMGSIPGFSNLMEETLTRGLISI